jgi:hypothetical protein
MASVLSSIIRRPPGTGWLVLHGGEPVDGNLQRTLALTQHAGNILTLTPTPQEIPFAEDAQNIWQEISGWAGKVRSLVDLDEISYSRLLDEMDEATLIYFPDTGAGIRLIEAIQSEELLEPLAAALDDGALIVASGNAAGIFGDWLVDREGAAIPGLAWIPSSVIQPHYVPNMACPLLTKRPGLFRLGIPEAAALALGPEEERELWGEVKPTLTFGIGWDR